MIKYFGQNEADKIIETYFNKNDGACIDVGASDGTSINNTKYFENLGWYCLCVEPNPRYFKELQKNRTNSINYAISGRNDELIFKVVNLGNDIEDAGSALTLDERLINQLTNSGYTVNITPIIVKTITLDYCIENFYKNDKIDFISIDTEGTELDVLKSFSIEKWNVKLFIIENNFNEPAIQDYLKQYGYKLDQRIGVNDFYIKFN